MCLVLTAKLPQVTPGKGSRWEPHKCRLRITSGWIGLVSYSSAAHPTLDALMLIRLHLASTSFCLGNKAFAGATQGTAQHLAFTAQSLAKASPALSPVRGRFQNVTPREGAIVRVEVLFCGRVPKEGLLLFLLD